MPWAWTSAIILFDHLMDQPVCKKLRSLSITAIGAELRGKLKSCSFVCDR